MARFTSRVYEQGSRRLVEHVLGRCGSLNSCKKLFDDGGAEPLHSSRYASSDS